MEAVMRIACSFLMSLLFAVGALAQSRLTINKIDCKDITEAAKEVPFSALVEGTVDDPDLLVYILVHEPRLNAWRSYRATVENYEADEAGKYRWNAICQFGEMDGLGVGASYQVKAIALDRKISGQARITNRLPADALRSQTIAIKRVK
jgi:hypothetical protein